MEQVASLAENIIKIEDIKEGQGHDIEERTLNFVIKQEPDVNAEEKLWIFKKEGETFCEKREIKKEDDRQITCLGYPSPYYLH